MTPNFKAFCLGLIAIFLVASCVSAFSAEPAHRWYLLAAFVDAHSGARIDVKHVLDTKTGKPVSKDNPQECVKLAVERGPIPVSADGIAVSLACVRDDQIEVPAE